MNCKQTWKVLLETVQQHGHSYTDQDGRECKELINHPVTITDASDAIELVRIIQQQHAWVYPNPEELKSIMLGSSQGAHEYSYSPRLFGTPNQVDGFIVPLLQQNPMSRRAIAILYRPDTDSKLASKNVPGLVSIHFRIVENKLSMTCHVRSSDVFIGFPANTYQMRCLQEYVSEKLGFAPGAINFFLSSAHYFTEYNTECEAILKKHSF